MRGKGQRASAYNPRQSQLVHATCLYVATKLGDLMDELLIIGGLVPALLIDQDQLPEGAEPHVGTMDLDLALQLAILDEGRYRQLTDRLRDAGFTMDLNAKGNPTQQRWVITQGGRVTLDFLISPTSDDDRPGRLKHLEEDFAAIITPGLRVAFQDRERVTLHGETLFAEKATRALWVCGAGAFVILKALAFDGRGENKDAYDLFYTLRNYGEGPQSVAARLADLQQETLVQRGLEIIRRDFSELDALGPRRVAAFVLGQADDALQADVVGFAQSFLSYFAPRS